MKCRYPGCDKGHYIVGSNPETYVSHDMAMDAEDLTYEGMLYQEEEPIWGVCPCCGGYDYDNCSNCSKVLK